MVEPKAFQDALLAYHARPCDPEAEAVRAAVLQQAWDALDKLYADTDWNDPKRKGISAAASVIATMKRTPTDGVTPCAPLTWKPSPGVQRFVVEITSASPVDRWAVLDALHNAKLALRTDIAVDPVAPDVTLTTEQVLKEVREGPALVDCAMCKGRGFYGIPGGPCAFCKGSGKTNVWRRTDRG